MTRPITMADEEGRLMWAFSPETDPEPVLYALAWAWATGLSTCTWDCPTRAGGYCLECHIVAVAAANTHRLRFGKEALLDD